MSDSAVSSPPPDLPADATIEQCLRRVTKTGLNDADFTANKARAAAEEELGLTPGFLKEPAWKLRSKDIISTAVEDANDGLSSPEQAVPPPKGKPSAKAGAKRKSVEKQSQKSRPRKKARKEESDEELSEPSLSEEEEVVSEDSEESDFEEEEKPKTKAKPKPKHKPAAKQTAAKKAASKDIVDSEESDAELGATPAKKKVEPTTTGKGSESELSDPPKTEDEVPNTNGKVALPEDDDSDMSVLIDEPPKPKRQKKTATDSKAKPKATTKSSKAAKGGGEDSPDEAEIKRLQGWLVKCGIRKLWYRELADCNTPKEKIRHLKKMLEEAGMSGRYSNEKAKEIKEARELAAELEAVQEFGGLWGQGEEETEERTRPKRGKSGSAVVEKEEDSSEEEEEDEEEEFKPKKRLPKGLVDFGDSGDDGSD